MMDAVYSVARPSLSEIKAMEIGEFLGVLERIPPLEAFYLRGISRVLGLSR